MARDKRTQAQLDFDRAKHGWAFCSADMLRGGMLERLEQLATQLTQYDNRHEELAVIREKANGKL